MADEIRKKYATLQIRSYNIELMADIENLIMRLRSAGIDFTEKIAEAMLKLLLKFFPTTTTVLSIMIDHWFFSKQMMVVSKPFQHHT